MTKVKEEKSEKPIYFVYAGAAPGDHIPILSKMFPDIIFELYDPTPIKVNDTDKIHTHQTFFTHDVARQWSNQSDKYVVFCSDIRREPAIEEMVELDMNMQLAWWNTMNPELTMLKFRLPWKPGTTIYPKGDIYIQPYAGLTSTETRLIIPKFTGVSNGVETKVRINNDPELFDVIELDKLVEYDNKTYEEQLFYHNNIARKKKYSTILDGKRELNLEKDHVDNCYDCARFIGIIEEYYRVVKGISDEDELKANVHDLVYSIQNEIVRGKNILTETQASFAFYKKRMYADSSESNRRIGVGRSHATMKNFAKSAKKKHTTI